MNGATRNLPASVRQRLLNLARARGIEFNRILVLYALERLLYRLSVSRYADRFILKGASLFTLWFHDPHRRTRDLDLLGKDNPDPALLLETFTALCELAVESDGLRFAADTLKARPVREQNEFGGIRVTLTAYLEAARIPLQVDIGFGDATVPEPESVDFPTLLEGFPAPHVRAYQKETAIAEKLHALVVLERNNSRMKDFFDLFILSQEFPFISDRLSAAVRDAFARRKTFLPAEIPDGLSQDFAHDKTALWRAFLKQSVSPPRDSLELPAVISALAAFLWPVLEAARSTSHELLVWEPGGPWKREMSP